MLRFLGQQQITDNPVATPILLAIVWGAGFGGFGSPLGSSSNLVAISYLEKLTGHEFMYVDWVIRFLPLLFIIMLLILQMGSLMNVGFEKVFLLQNDLNMSASDVINTYVYRVGLVQNNYSYSTAVGLFNSVINMALVIAANQLSKKLANESLW